MIRVRKHAAASPIAPAVMAIGLAAAAFGLQSQLENWAATLTILGLLFVTLLSILRPTHL